MALLRAQGCWALALRYAFLFGFGSRDSLDYDVPELGVFARLGVEVFEPAEQYVLANETMRRDSYKNAVANQVSGSDKDAPRGKEKKNNGGDVDDMDATKRGDAIEAAAAKATKRREATLASVSEQSFRKLSVEDRMALEDAGRDDQYRAKFAAVAARGLRRYVEQTPDLELPGMPDDRDEGGDAFGVLARVAVDAYFDNDLFKATCIFLNAAKGSFGLCVSNSLDAHRQVCIAARGQPMSIGFYPSHGLIVYGSELAAVKVPLLYDAKKKKTAGDVEAPSVAKSEMTDRAVRLDLDDLGGEVALVDFGSGEEPNVARGRRTRKAMRHVVCGGRATLTLLEESLHDFKRFEKRLVVLEDNPLIPPPPPPKKPTDDPVGRDVAAIPNAVARIRADWRGCDSFNRLTFWTFQRALTRHILRNRGAASTHADETGASDAPAAVKGAVKVDLLVTGCEVSLWMAEQFVGDLALCFPKLNAKTISANKLLGMLGQDIRTPQTGFPFFEDAWDLRDAVVLIVSHSGQTFASLGVANLLQGLTESIFVMCAEWDTQIGKQLRKLPSGSFESRVFSTDVGVLPAEPCSLSVVATHAMLTQLLLQLSLVLISNADLRAATGANAYTTFALGELERCSQLNVGALREIVDVTSDKNKELRFVGRRWADHILESPRVWALSAAYILVTVTLGRLLIFTYVFGSPRDPAVAFVARGLDALVYLFLPEIWTAVLRLIQGRPLMHRMGHRTIVVCDVPWVAQCVDAFASKCFARAYAVASATFLSGNPVDHLVHRHTHRVTRGTIIAAGIPDGRLSALVHAEAAVSLAINQATSIQSFGCTAETVTVGHNPHKLALATHAIFLDRHRPLYLSEHLIHLPRTENDRRLARVIESLRAKRRSSAGSLDSSKYSDASGLGPDASRRGSASSSAKKTARLAATMQTVLGFTSSAKGGENGRKKRGSAAGDDDAPYDDDDPDASKRGASSVAWTDAVYDDDLEGGTYNNKSGTTTPSSLVQRLVPWNSGSARIRQRISRSRDDGKSHGALVCDFLALRDEADDGAEEETKHETGRLEAVQTSSGHHLLEGYVQTHNFDESMTAFGDGCDEASTRAVISADKELALRSAFENIDADASGRLDLDEFLQAHKMLADTGARALDPAIATQLFHQFATPCADEECAGKSGNTLDLDGFRRLMEVDSLSALQRMAVVDGEVSPLQNVQPKIDEAVFGLALLETMAGAGKLSDYDVAQTQSLSMQLYESRIASLQRCVAFFVLFHELATTVANWWSRWTFGLFGYSIDRTQSIMRVATTASPVSGAEVRGHMLRLAMKRQFHHTLDVLRRGVRAYKRRAALKAEFDEYVKTRHVELYQDAKAE